MEDVGAGFFGAERPDGAGGEFVPVVVLFEEGGDFADGVADADAAGFDVLCYAVVEGFGDHGDFVLLIGGEGVAHDC